MIFEKIFCLNLDRRTDRWEESEREFKKLGLKVERFSAKWPVNETYYRCLKEASKYNSSLILEDDVEFLGDFADQLKQLPNDWDMVAIGANLNGVHKDRVSENLYRYTNGYTAHALGYSKKMAKWLVENFDPKSEVIYDEWLRRRLTDFKCYIVYPMMAVQRSDFSDYRNRFVDYEKYFNQSKSFFQ